MKLRTIKVAFLAMMMTAASVYADEPFREHRYDSFKAGTVTPQSIVFVGNSITNMGSWSETFGDDARCLNRGNSGAVSEETLENIESVIYGHPAKIFLMIGTNDLGTQYAEDIPFNNVKNMLERIQDESPETEIYLTSVFPSTVGYRTLEGEASLNKRYQTLVDDVKIHYLDLYDALMGITTGEISLDNLHMGPAGYKVWCDAVAEIAGDETLKSTLIDAADMTSPTCGQTTSFGMRAQMFCELPIYSNDVWIFGDEMVNGGEWHELLGLPNVKNRGWYWGHGGLTITSYTNTLEYMLTNDADKMTKEKPKQIFFYVGTGELNSNTNAATVKSRYKSLITKAQSLMPDTKLYILSLTPHWTTASNTLTKSYNEQFEAVAEEMSVTYIDLFTPLALDNGTPNPEYLPTKYVWGKGYNKIAQILSQYIDDAQVLSDEAFDTQYAIINARNTLGKAVTEAKSVVALESLSDEYKTTLQAQIDEANTMLRGTTAKADEFSAKADELSTATSALNALANGGSDYRETLISALADIEKSANKLNLGDEYGQYSITYDAWDEDLATLREMLADNSTTYDEYEAALCVVRLQNAIGNVSINMPQTGSYIRVKASTNYINNSKYKSTFNGVQNYLSSNCKKNTVNSSSDWQALCVDSKTDDNEATTIFYYAPVTASEYGNLISYADGRYAYTGLGNMLGFHQGTAATNASVATTVGFQAALAESGAYHLRYNIQGSDIESARVLAISGTDEVVNGGSATAETLKSYVWSNVELEKVTTLPVTIDSDGSAAFSVPVAVTVPEVEGVDIYTTTIKDAVLTFHQVKGGENLAASTAFTIIGSAGTTLHFDIINTDDVDNSYVSDAVHASPALSAYTAVDGTTTFAKATNTNSSLSTLFTKLSDGDDVNANSFVIDVASALLSDSYTNNIGAQLINNDVEIDLSKTAGINTIVVDKADGTKTIYDLQGRKINSPTRGINIINGTKVINL